MFRRIVVSGLALFLVAATALAQSSGIQIFRLPDTATPYQWVKLGTYNAYQQGYNVDVKIVTSNGFNAQIAQDQVTYIHFKSSNADTVDTNGFAGDSWWYQTGPNTSAPSQVAWVANVAGTSATSFTLFAYLAPWSGDGSYYVVDVPPGTTWTNSATGGQPDPGTGSSTVLYAQNRFYVGSNSSFLGNVGIGTTSTNEKLEVNGNLSLTTGSGAHMTYQDGTVQSTAWTGVLSGGDYAESVNVSGNRNTYEPGDVLVIDPATEGKFVKSSTPYATTVTGIYSTKPGVTGRRQHTAQEHMKEEVPMAMTGIVPTKVTAENGPIKPGDLLVTSSKSGYAMKGTDRSQMLGAVIGKAIGHLDTGTGLIETVVTLQ